ncbi:hypothetical protein L0Z42_00765 [Burkholderia multivorans]|nr:hypothetical protein [Burkholderia multivorans]MCO1369111.1 hypothetical protein [Burkholderia multivorans]MCO1459164.1 hypothetical protein [Burkholderia multivorans]MCO1468615.1 hypothetical protein [Burkholderia multivorans]UQO17234.1 hypothetical protein L0Z02_00755 [Burkholderia multivorans]UQO85385.1 hypothetical protein L0Y86_28155 [Burkholderia multivorans]
MESIKFENESAAIEVSRLESNIEIVVPGEPADFTVINVEGCLSSSSVLG